MNSIASQIRKADDFVWKNIEKTCTDQQQVLLLAYKFINEPMHKIMRTIKSTVTFQPARKY